MAWRRSLRGARTVAVRCALAAAAGLALAGPAWGDALNDRVDLAFSVADQRVRDVLPLCVQPITSATASYPSTTKLDGTWGIGTAGNWPAGLFPGVMWKLYGRSGESFWSDNATTWTLPLAYKATSTSGDLSFNILNSFLPLYKLTNDPAHLQVIWNAAASKNSTFNATVGTFKTSGGFSEIPGSDYYSLIDHLMDQEILIYAARTQGVAAYEANAITHGNRMAEVVVRADGGSFQRAVFNSATGQFLDGMTKQGYRNSSTWGRGQAWAMYGFAVTHRETGQCLDVARRMTDYWIARLPADGVAYYDFDEMGIQVIPYRDTSGASIATAAMFDLAASEPDPARAQAYYSAALKSVWSLAGPDYLSRNTIYDSIVGKGAYTAPVDALEQGLVWGDYYYLEALDRARPVWAKAGGGQWLEKDNWSSGMVHNLADSGVTLGGRLAGPATVTLSATATKGSVRLDSTAGYTISGGGTLRMDVTAGAAEIDAASGSHTIAVAVETADDTVIKVAQGGDVLTISGAIANPGGRTLTKRGAGMLVMSGAQSHGAGAEVVVEGGTLRLSGSSGTATGAASWIVHSGGTLELDNTAGTNGDRIGDGAAMRLRGGTLRVVGGGESVGQLVAGVGASKVELTGGAVAFGSLGGRSSGATVDFAPAGVSIGGAANVNGILGGWATAGGTDFAAASGGAVGAYGGYYTGALASASAGDNARPAVSEAGVPTVTINSLNLSGATGVAMAPGATLTVASGGVIANTSGGISGGQIASGAADLIVHAAADITVDSSIVGAAALTKSGGAALTLGGANTYGGATFVNAGTLRTAAAGALPAGTAMSIAAGATLDLAGWAQTVGSLSGGGAVALGGAALTVGAGDASSTFGGAISGAGDVVKVGSGQLALSGKSTFGGSLAIRGGAVVLGGHDVLPATAAVVLGDGASGSGALDLAGHEQQIGGLSVSGSGAANRVTNSSAELSTLTINQPADGTYGGAIDGRIRLIKSGAGTLTLSGISSYSDSTRVAAGTLKLAADSALPATTSLILGDGSTVGGTFDLGGRSQEVAGLFADGSGTNVLTSTGAAGTLTVRTAYNLAYNGQIAGQTSLVKTGPKMLELGGSNSFTGTVTVSEGTLRLANSAALGDVSGATIVAGGAVLDLNGQAVGAEPLLVHATPAGGGSALVGAGSWAGPVMLLGDATVGGGSTITISGVVEGAHQLTKANSGTMYLTTANTLSGPVSVIRGKLSLSGALGTALAVPSWTVTNGGTLEMNNVSGASNSQRIGDSAPIALGGGTLTLVSATTAESVGQVSLLPGASTISTSGTAPNLSIASLGSRAAGATLNFSGNGIAIAGAENTNGILAGWATYNSSNFARVNNGTMAAYAAYYTGNLASAAPTDNAKPSAAQSGLDSLTINTLLLAGSGVTVTMKSDATLTVGAGGVLLTSSTSAIHGGSITSGTEDLTVFSTAASTISSAIVGNIALTKSGGSRLTISSPANAWTGPTYVNANTLACGAAGVIPPTSAVVVATGATLDLGGFDQTVGSIAGGGSVSLGVGNLTVGGDNTSTTLSGAISGSGNVTKIGAGVWTLTGGSSFKGTMNIVQGTVSVPWVDDHATNTPLGCATLTTSTITLGGPATAGTLRYTGGDGASNRPLAVGGAGGGIFEITQADTELVYDGGLSIPAGTFTKTGPGTLILDGPQSHGVGSVLMTTAGTLRLLSDSGTPATASSAAVANLALLASAGVTRLEADQTLKSLSAGAAGALDLNGRAVRLYALGDEASLNAAAGAGWIIDSSAGANTAIGIADVADAHGDMSILMRPTRPGDATLDGTVNFADLLVLSQNYNAGGRTWDQGDSNYDGTVNFADLLALSQNYNQSFAAPPAAAVPEPGAGLWILFAAWAMSRRRGGNRS